jgi:chromate reductase
MSEKKIGVFVGSLRKDSFNLKMAKALSSVAPASLKLEIIEIGNLPFYNQDLEDSGTVPASWTEFRNAVKSCDGFLFLTPEYNRSVPAVLKNALDVGSRPYGKSVWDGKPGAVMSVSPGAIGGFGANHHLRQSMVFLNVLMMQQPEAYVGNAASLFDDKGAFATESIRKFAGSFMQSFAAWVEKHSAVKQ